MGQHFDKDRFTPADHVQFRERLQEQIAALKGVIETPGFSGGQSSFGAELELYIVGKDGCPAAKNQEILDRLQHPLLTEELNKFNLEINLSPVAARGRPFQAMADEASKILTSLHQTAAQINAEIATIGILPTLNSSHLKHKFMTDLPRYRALTNELLALKGEPFMVDINGLDSLKMHADEVTLEGANTSFQVHFKVPASGFANLYNAAQLSTPLVLALAGNSPTFLGQRLWQETRIALFKQSIDNRIHGLTKWRQPARVCFGHGWVREGAWELFAENVALYCPILPYVSPKDTPFAELNLHHGTIWSWNRAVFEPNHGGHLRIEYRTLPAGPSLIDMMANAALAIGLTQALSKQIPNMLHKIPFQYAEYNFYRAAQDGLAAKILWPQGKQHSLKEQHITDVISNLLALAGMGLSELGVELSEIDHLMNIIERRLATQQTGAIWQLRNLAKHQQKHNKQTALKKMLHDYMIQSQLGEPVSTWQN